MHEQRKVEVGQDKVWRPRQGAHVTVEPVPGQRCAHHREEAFLWLRSSAPDSGHDLTALVWRPDVHNRIVAPIQLRCGP